MVVFPLPDPRSWKTATDTLDKLIDPGALERFCRVLQGDLHNMCLRMFVGHQRYSCSFTSFANRLRRAFIGQGMCPNHAKALLVLMDATPSFAADCASITP